MKPAFSGGFFTFKGWEDNMKPAWPGINTQGWLTIKPQEYNIQQEATPYFEMVTFGHQYLQ